MMKKLLLTAGITLFAAGLFAQGVSNKSAKINYLEFPEIDVTGITSANIAIYPGNIDVKQNFLKRKSDLKGQMPHGYYTFNEIRNVASAADVKIEIAFGDFEVIPTADNVHQIPCKQKGAKLNKDNILECPAHYYDVTYNLPVVLIIRDKSGNVINSKHLTSPGMTTFGYDKTGLSGYIYKPELIAAYSQATTQGLLAKRALLNRMDEVAVFVQQALYFSSTEIKLDFASGKGKAHDYSDLDAAQASAISGLEAIDNGKDSKPFFEKAIAIWTKALEELDMSNKKARINRKIASELHMNLAKAYFFLNEPEKGQASIDEAIKLLRFDSNMNRVEEGKVWKARLMRQKNQLGSIEANRSLTKGNRTPVTTLLSVTRVKEKNQSYAYLQAGNKYFPLLDEHNAFAPTTEQAETDDEQKQPETIEEAIEMHKNSAWEDKVENTPTYGYYISLTFPYTYDEIDAGIGSVTHLNAIIASGVKLKRVDPAIGKLTELTVLNFANNQLTEFPKEIGNCTKLKKLNLKNNNLTSLPIEIGQCKELKSLKISGNNIPQSEIDAIQKLLPKCKIK